VGFDEDYEMMKINMEKISVIILTKNSENNIERCLLSILKQTYSPFEIIVVDAGSTDHTIQMINFHKTETNPNNISIKIINEAPNTSFDKARQSGLLHSEGEILAYIDSDVELSHPHWIECMSAPMFHGYNSSEKLIPLDYIAGVQTLAKCRNTDPQFLKKIHASFEYKSDVIGINNYQPIGTSHLIIRKDLIQNVGGFEDTYTGEDTKLTEAIMKQGYYFIYLKSEKCYHHHATTYTIHLKKRFRNITNKIKDKFIQLWRRSFERK